MPPRKKHDPDSDEDEPAPVAEDLLRQMASLCTLLTQQLGSSTPAAQPSPDTQLRLNLPVPTFSGYSDSKSAEHFLADLSAYQTAVGATDDVILRRVLPAALWPWSRWRADCKMTSATLDLSSWCAFWAKTLQVWWTPEQLFP
ncbi:uncharacterized protein LOC135398004 isoform X2 [Ornithodoros turicata]|uniref:uncharacterized protein LOC135398004 isoform X2 n=1 Tax=Ornithodoros turicata TaxID=34597 RepID=UPI003139EF2C